MECVCVCAWVFDVQAGAAKSDNKVGLMSDDVNVCVGVCALLLVQATSLWVFVLYFWCWPAACGCLCATFDAGHQLVGVNALLLVQATSLWVCMLYFWCRSPACGCLCATFNAGHQPAGQSAFSIPQHCRH